MTAGRRKALTDAAAALEGVIPDAFTGDAHAYLMAVYKDPRNETALRVDAAKAAIRYEKPALSSVQAQVDANLHTWLVSAGAEEERSRSVVAGTGGDGPGTGDLECIPTSPCHSSR